MKVNSKIWILGFLIMVAGVLGIAGIWVVKVDPFFHYHAPNTAGYYYELNNQRSQNDGISKYFEYDALITGTSMTENFKTSEMDEIFGTDSVKVSYSGGSYREINDNLINALNSNKNLKIIVRGLDMNYFFDESDRIDKGMGEYPLYLYDDNIFNDVNYIFNRDVIFGRVGPMLTAGNGDDFAPGITSFDRYSNWMSTHSFGINSVLSASGEMSSREAGEAIHLTDAERAIISDNICQNVTSLAEAYPDVTFYYFFTPYSALWWQSLVSKGTIYRQIEAEKFIIETILPVDNIKLYSFNNRTDITTDINNYTDIAHYGSWINSLILRWMYDGEYLLTEENYEEYLQQELSFYTAYDYSLLEDQEDYENDYFAEALINEELSGVSPIRYTENMLEYLYYADHTEIRLQVDDISDYKYFVFYQKINPDDEEPSANIYNENGDKIAEITAVTPKSDKALHQYLIDVGSVEGTVTVVLDNDYSDIALY